MKRRSKKKNSKIIVDYAHTPDAYEKVLSDSAVHNVARLKGIYKGILKVFFFSLYFVFYLYFYLYFYFTSKK